MESVIKWRTGEPKETGRYLITTKTGVVFVDFWYYSTDNILEWDRHLTSDVIAWCPLSEIEPYKE